MCVCLLCLSVCMPLSVSSWVCLSVLCVRYFGQLVHFGFLSSLQWTNRNKLVRIDFKPDVPFWHNFFTISTSIEPALTPLHHISQIHCVIVWEDETFNCSKLWKKRKEKWWRLWKKDLIINVLVMYSKILTHWLTHKWNHNVIQIHRCEIQSILSLST